MKISPQWIRDFVDLPVDDRRLAEDLTSIGIAVEGISGEGANTVFEMEIGTNRPDAMNHYGVAREAAALYKIPLKPIETSAAKAVKNGNRSGTAEAVPFPVEDNAALKHSSTQNQNSGTAKAVPFQIQIDDREGCARYTAQIVRGVKIKSSPEKIASRLALVDQRAINNAADASNYTLWEMGHPTHAFDLDLLQGGEIVVRRARQGETLKTLDGVDRKLSPEDLIIADANRPVALAGVMGGFETMITEKTKNVLIESAWFDPVAVRKTAKRHGLHTDASHRFERGADYAATPLACALVAQRIVDSGGGELVGNQIDAVAHELEQAPIQIRISQVQRLLGAKLEIHEIVAILKRLGFELVPEPDSQPEFLVRIPSWRLDIEREIDLIEEIARLHGYNNFPNTLPAFAGAVVEDPNAAKQAKLRSSLLALGYNEAVSLSFVSHEDAEAFSSTPLVEIANPLSAEASLMRSSLVPGMLDMLAYNLNRGTENVRLFEIGDIYEASGATTAEHRRICIAATRSALQHDLPQGGLLDKSKATSDLDIFRSFKGDVTTLLGNFQHRALSFDPETAEYYQPGRSARALLDGEAVAQFGPIDSQIAAGRKLRQEVFIAEVFADRLYHLPLRQLLYRPLAKFPAVERDFSFVFRDEITFDKIEASIRAIRLPDLRSLTPVEIFRAGAVPAGSHSILLRAKFQSLERTLREDEVNEWSAKIVNALVELGGTQRA
ncbi:MAG: phenylalanyl-tRNA synthetase beta subunit [Acidobacteriaceae bacterium]|nr:phenylalanyl-tRNA synthetase beta subunit [Acidobacteriaceae bacterium]